MPTINELMQPRRGSMPRQGYFTGSASGENEIEVPESIPAAIRGFGQGATAGLIQYPQAGLMSLTAGPDYSFKQALADLRADNERLAKNHSGAWFGGNIAGGITTAALSGGTTLPGLVGRGAAMGGVSGFTKDEDLTDAAIGAGTGAIFGASGKLINAGSSKAAAYFKTNWIDKFREEAPDFTRTLSDQQIARILSTKDYSNFPSFRAFWDATKEVGKSTAKIAAEAVGPAAGGAAAGAGGALLIGEDPYKGAVAGTAMALATAKNEAAREALRKGAEWGSGTLVRNPWMTVRPGQVLGTGGAQAAAPVLASQTNVKPVDEPYPWEKVTPEVKNEKYPWEK